MPKNLQVWSMKFQIIPRLPYSDFLKMQRRQLEEARAFSLACLNTDPSTADPFQVADQLSRRELILFCEHPLVMTAGFSTRSAEKQLAQRQAAQMGAEFFPTDRGGKLALHAPGQLMIYPWVYLDHPLKVHEWVNLLLKTTLSSLKEASPQTEFFQKEDGIYTREGKLCFVGIRVHRLNSGSKSFGFSTHGLAINLYNNLEVYKKFTSCGVKNRPVDRLWSKPPTNLEEHIKNFCENWCLIFQRLNSSKPVFELS
jgi:lipoyl(octanoyl) transferase